MSLIDSSRAFVASLVSVGRERLELATTDIEEELLRAAWAVAAMMLIAVLAALTLAAWAAAVVLVFWDRSPVGALLGVGTAFGVVTAALAWRLASAVRAKPPLLAATLDELAKDAQWLRGLGA